MGLSVDFDKFVTARVPVLVRTATALCGGDLALAEDLVQDVLIKVHRRWASIAELASTDAYVRRMLVNEFLSWRRKWARLVPVAEVRTAERVPDPAAGHADRQLFRAEIGRLPRAKQVVLTLRYYGGLSDAEIAEAMGCSVGTVRSHASRALATLRVQPTLRENYLATVTERDS